MPSKEEHDAGNDRAWAATDAERIRDRLPDLAAAKELVGPASGEVEPGVTRT
ncbi:MAG: hypothetical protein ACLQGP_15635 [Isosphaeraceae bacterium]